MLNVNSMPQDSLQNLKTFPSWNSGLLLASKELDNMLLVVTPGMGERDVVKLQQVGVPDARVLFFLLSLSERFGKKSEQSDENRPFRPHDKVTGVFRAVKMSLR